MSYKTHFRPKGRGRTACGKPAKRSRIDTANVAKVTCESCKRTVRAWARWARVRGLPVASLG